MRHQQYTSINYKWTVPNRKEEEEEFELNKEGSD